MRLRMQTIEVKSRYGEKRSFVPVDEKTYRFDCDSMHFCRMGGKDNQPDIDPNDLGFFDPDGGPFISEGYEIGGRKVVRIMSKKGGVYFEVE